jgi:dolichol-phosphate mannosyltransferase
MYRGLRVLATIPAWDEESKIGDVVRRVPMDIVDECLVVDDGSTDRTAEVARELGATVISLGSVRGVGLAILTGLHHGRDNGFDVVVPIAGNNKDAPEEIPRLLDPVVDQGCDFVMGSRFLEGGGLGGDMPAYRKLATRMHPVLLGLFCGKRITESTNGFRAIRVSLLDDERIDLEQEWLEHYEMEVYLLMKVLKLGYRHTEVPVTKIYPPKRLGITKMRPVLDWWNILRPVFLVGLGLRK